MRIIDMDFDAACTERWERGMDKHRSRKVFNRAGRLQNVPFQGDPIAEAAEEIADLRNYIDEAARQGIFPPDDGDFALAQFRVWQLWEFVKWIDERGENRDAESASTSGT